MDLDPDSAVEAVPEAAPRRGIPTPMEGVLVGAFLLSLMRPLYHEDLWWQLLAGRWIQASWGVPRANLFSFSASDHPWIEHQWLGDLLLYLLNEWAGPLSFFWVRGWSFALAMAGLYGLLRWRGGLVPSLVLTAGATLAGLPFLVTGPVMFTPLLLVALLYLLEHPRWRGARRLFLMPMLIGLWANLHGSVLLALGLLGAYLVGSGWDARKGRALEAISAPVIWFPLSAILALCTPYYSGLYRLGLENLWQLLASMPLRLQVLPWWYFALVLAAAVGLGLTIGAAGRQMRWRLVLPLVALTPVVVLEPEFSGLWGVWGAAVAMEHLQQVAARVRHDAQGFLPMMEGLTARLRAVGDRFHRMSQWEQGLRGGAWTALAMAGSVALLSAPPERLKSWPWLEGLARQVEVPAVFAADLLPAIIAGGPTAARVLAPEDMAGFLAWRAYPELWIFHDARANAYPLQVEEDYARFEKAATGWEEVLETYHVDLVLWPSDSFQVRALLDSGDWRRLSANTRFSLLGRVQARAGEAVPSPPPLPTAERGAPRDAGKAPTPSPAAEGGLFRPNRAVTP